MLPAPIARMSYQEYLTFEEASETKHEYVNGEVYAMSGGTINHGALAVAMSTALSNALAGRPCRVLSSDVRVKSKATAMATYPGVTVVCDRLEVDAAQHEPLIEVYRRNERGNWELVAEARRGDRVELASCGPSLVVDVDAIYRDPLAG